MADYFQVDFLGVETKKSGDAIALRYSINGVEAVHVVDGGYVETGDKIVQHLEKYYGSKQIDHVVLTHPDQDHANGLRKVLEDCNVKCLWMNRPWLYADDLIDRFATYNSVEALRRKLRSTYSASATLEDIANEKKIPIYEMFQGSVIGAFTVLAPTKQRFLDLVVDSDKTPDVARSQTTDGTFAGVASLIRVAVGFVKAAWGGENFPISGTSNENEMSAIQFARIAGKTILLTGDTGREGLTEAADYAPLVGLDLPGIDRFQVPHHGGRHNVNTEVLDRWVGKRLPAQPAETHWVAICSSAKADEDHPKKVVVRAMIHRGAHFVATEGQNICTAQGITREGWSALPQTAYPDEEEE